MKKSTIKISFPASGTVLQVYKTGTETRYDRDGEHAGSNNSLKYLRTEIQVETYLNIEAEVYTKLGDRYSPTRYNAKILSHKISTIPIGIVSEIRLPRIGADEIILEYQKILDPKTEEWHGDFDYDQSDIVVNGAWGFGKIYE